MDIIYVCNVWKKLKLLFPAFVPPTEERKNCIFLFQNVISNTLHLYNPHFE